MLFILSYTIVQLKHQIIHDIETRQYKNVNQFQKQLYTFSLVYRNTWIFFTRLFLSCFYFACLFYPPLRLFFFLLCFLFHLFFGSIFCSIPFFSFIFRFSVPLCLFLSSLLFLLFILLPIFSPITLFSISAHLRNSITPRFYIPPINILECATNSNREREPIIRNEGINQSRVSLEGNKIEKKEKKYRNIDGSNVIITQSPRNSNARREIVSSHRDPTASEDAAKHDRIGRPDKTSNLLSRPFLIGLLLLPTSSTGSTARIIYAKLM